MEAITAELIDMGDRRDARGRRRTPAAQRAEFGAYQQSGLTQAAFAAREGLRYSTFAHWVQKALKAVARTAPMTNPKRPVPRSDLEHLKSPAGRFKVSSARRR